MAQANRAPVAVPTALRTGPLSPGGKASDSVDLGEHFSDPDGDALTYTAAVVRHGAWRPSAVSGATVTIIGVFRPARATITDDREQDPDGLSATQQRARHRYATQPSAPVR